MPGFGSFERDFDRFSIAHLADENHFRRLAQGCAQSEREGRRVAVKLALVYGRLLMVVRKLDRIFDGQDVNGSLLIHAVDDGRKRGR